MRTLTSDDYLVSTALSLSKGLSGTPLRRSLPLVSQEPDPVPEPVVGSELPQGRHPSIFDASESTVSSGNAAIISGGRPFHVERHISRPLRPGSAEGSEP